MEPTFFSNQFYVYYYRRSVLFLHSFVGLYSTMKPDNILERQYQRLFNKILSSLNIENRWNKSIYITSHWGVLRMNRISAVSHKEGTSRNILRLFSPIFICGINTFINV